MSFWLDLKNLSLSNSKNSASRLDSIVQDFNLDRKKIIIESPVPELLMPFQKLGYPTSFYLPGNLNKTKEENLINKMTSLNVEIGKNRTDYLSFPLTDYNTVKNYFPHSKKLLWHVGDINGYETRKKIWECLFDENVEVVLLSFNASKGNR